MPAVQQGMTEEMVASLARYEDADLPRREKLAVRFAERMAVDHQNVDDEFFAELRREFTDPEIFELGMITGMFIGYGRLLAMLDLENPEEPGSSWSEQQWTLRPTVVKSLKRRPCEFGWSRGQEAIVPRKLQHQR